MANVFAVKNSKTKKIVKDRLGRPVWGIEYQAPDGTRVRRRVGTRAEAEAALAAELSRLHTGRWDAPSPDRLRTTLRDLQVLWDRERSPRLTASTRASYDLCWRVLVQHLGAGLPIHLIDLRRVSELRAALAPGRTHATVNRHLALLRAVLRFAEAQELLARAPRITLSREPVARDRVATDAELEAIMAAATPWMRLAIHLAVETGQRAGAIALLTWDRVDFENKEIRWPAHKTKRAVITPMTDACFDALTRWRDELPALIENDARLYRWVKRGRVDSFVVGCERNTISKNWAELTAKLKIKNLRFHDLRHTTATRLRRAGVDVWVIKQLLGHSSWAAAARYQTVDRKDLGAAVSRIGAPPLIST